MTISFDGIPSNNRVPFFFAEFNSSKAQQGPSILSYRGLIIGQKLAAGSAVANTVVRVSSADQAAGLFGRGSMLHRMCKAWFRVNKSTELRVGVLADNDAGTAATFTVTITVTTAVAGTINLYIGGELVQVPVAAGAAQNDIATALAAAVTANGDLAVTANAATNVVTLTHRHKGAVGSDLNVRVNYQDGELLPAGVGVTIAAGVTGATNPVLTTLIAALGDMWFHIIAHPYTDATSLAAIEAELKDRFGPTRMLDGIAIASAAGTQAVLSTLGDTRNCAHSVILAQPGKLPLMPPCEFAAAAAGVVALYAAIDPARPLQTLPVAGAKPPAEGDLFKMQERDLLLHDGIATSKVAAGGEVQLERIVTTYQTNAAGAPDTAYLDITTLLTLMYLRWSFRNIWPVEYPRHKLADDGTRFGAGQAVLTPKIAKARAVAWFAQMEELGLVENREAFKANLVVERNAADPNRLDFLIPPDLVNALIVGAASLQFRI